MSTYGLHNLIKTAVANRTFLNLKSIRIYQQATFSKSQSCIDSLFYITSSYLDCKYETSFISHTEIYSALKYSITFNQKNKHKCIKDKENILQINDQDSVQQIQK